MTREQAKQWLPILQAYSEGKVIQMKGPPKTGEWYDFNQNETEWQSLSFDLDVEEYRVKPDTNDNTPHHSR